MSQKKLLFICLGILGFGLLATIVIFSTEPTAKQEGATKQTAMLVDVIEVGKGDFGPVITATGTVQPVEDVTLSPLVGGQVIYRDPAFTPGGFVQKGELLLQIEPADYRNTLELRKSELMQMQTNRNVEMGRQQVAQQDLSLIGGDSLSEEQKALVLRKPQLRAIEAQMQAARASVEQAQLNLNRTQVRAPFDAHILAQNVTQGSQVSIGADLGRIVGTDFYWVVVNLPVSQLKWLTFPNATNEKGSKVKIESRTAWKEGTFREGYLYRQVGALDNQTRLARVLVRIEDPLARAVANEGKPQLMIGGFVDAQIEAEEIENVVRINRDFVRSNNTVWVMHEGKLEIREVQIVMNDERHSYISSGLNDKDHVVITNLSTVADGIALRTDAGTGSIEKETPQE